MIKEHILSERKLWLHLDGNTFDSSNYGNNGIGTGITYESGHIGQCAIFNATTDKIVIDNETQFDFDRTDKFTISMWFKLNDINRVRFFVSKQADGSSNGISFWQNNQNKIYFQFVPVGVTGYLNAHYLFTSTNAWTHITITYDGSSTVAGIKMYINGNEVTTTKSGGPLTNTTVNDIPVEIGNRSGTYNFNGDIDEVVVENRVWTASEVSQYYNETA